jgi:septum site-determining protein MinC
MKIVVNSIDYRYLEAISFDNLDDIDNFSKNFIAKKGPLEANIFVINESICSNDLSKIKNTLHKINICNVRIYSNNRNTVLTGKSLKIDSTLQKEQEIQNKFFLLDSKKRDDTLYSGTVRSGDRISSNGNLCIVGDVNPGAIISAKKNIYVWGKLLGIAVAGKDGNINATIASLYLNPLQLRIADVIAIGPKDKPKNFYPEVAVIEKKTINIKPLLIETKN